MVRGRQQAVAGHVGADGYRRICLNNTMYLAGRLAWFLTHGHHPEGVIDHINGMRDDNRISNLRDVTRAVNNRNMKIHRDGRYPGVIPSGKKWMARIYQKGKHRHLGTFNTVEEATLARRLAEEREMVWGGVRDEEC